MFNRILVANDGSEGAFRALSAAIDLARRYGSALAMISVEQLPQFPATVGEVVEEKDVANHRFGEVVERAEALAAREGVALRCQVVAGHVVARIVETIRAEGYDLLVIGFMGHSRLYNAVIGGTADRLVDLAPCAILVVK